MNNLVSILKVWVPLAVVLSLVCIIIYITGQQNYRQNANDPQCQMAEDAANAIDKGADPKSLIPGSPMELSGTLSPYLIIYDGFEKPVASGALISGKIPTLPPGVLAYVKNNGVDVISWKPQSGLRQALVIQKTSGNKLYFVAAGRSLRKTEERISLLIRQITLGWICSVAIVFVGVCGIEMFTKNR